MELQTRFIQHNFYATCTDGTFVHRRLFTRTQGKTPRALKAHFIRATKHFAFAPNSEHNATHTVGRFTVVTEEQSAEFAPISGDLVAFWKRLDSTHTPIHVFETGRVRQGVRS